MRTLAQWIVDLFRDPEPPRLSTEDERVWSLLYAERCREEQDYRDRYGPLVRRGRSLAAGVNAGLGLPDGTVVFDDAELRHAHARTWNR